AIEETVFLMIVIRIGEESASQHQERLRESQVEERGNFKRQVGHLIPAAEDVSPVAVRITFEIAAADITFVMIDLRVIGIGQIQEEAELLKSHAVGAAKIDHPFNGEDFL